MFLRGGGVNIAKVFLVLGGVVLFISPFFVQIDPVIFLFVMGMIVGGVSLFMIGKA